MNDDTVYTEEGSEEDEQLVTSDEEIQGEELTENEQALLEITERQRAERDKQAAMIPEEPEVEPETELEGEGKTEEIPEEEKLVVNGQEQSVPEKDLIEAGRRAEQKERAANEKFEQAAKLIREAERRAEELKVAEQKLNDAKKNISAANVEDISAEFASALLTDEEKAGKIFAETLKRQTALEEQIQSLTGGLNEISGGLNEVRSVAEMQVKNQGAELSAYYQENYGDIAGNDQLHVMAQGEAQKIRAAEPNLTERQVIDKAAGSVQNWLKSLPGFQGNNNGESVDNKTNLKRKMNKPVKQAGGRTQGKPPVKRKTAAQVVEEMKQASAFG